MSSAFRISSVITGILTIASIAIGLEVLSLNRAGMQGGAMVLGIGLVLLVILTIISGMITLGIWIAQKNRKLQNDHSLHL